MLIKMAGSRLGWPVSTMSYGKPSVMGPYEEPDLLTVGRRIGRTCPLSRPSSTGSA